MCNWTGLAFWCKRESKANTAIRRDRRRRHLRERGDGGEDLRALLQVEPEAGRPEQRVREAEHQRDVQHRQVGLVGHRALAAYRRRFRRHALAGAFGLVIAFDRQTREDAARLAVEAHVVHGHGPRGGRHQPEKHQRRRYYQVLNRRCETRYKPSQANV